MSDELKKMEGIQDSEEFGGELLLKKLISWVSKLSKEEDSTRMGRLALLIVPLENELKRRLTEYDRLKKLVVGYDDKLKELRRGTTCPGTEFAINRFFKEMEKDNPTTGESLSSPLPPPR